ncbi:MAG: hypothetical protein LBE36_09445 [Flavobacteriaceae bacterium]|jgi:hypothetical protein|nr:hypothetical protein [Flavobacteriaceae bacterium]
MKKFFYTGLLACTNNIMKKTNIFIFSCGLFCFANTNAQVRDSLNIQTMDSIKSKHFSVGIELLGTSGFGLELAALIHPKWVLRGGISMLPINVSIWGKIPRL